MKEQESTNKVLYIVIAIIIVIGAIICGVKGFNVELLYSSRQQIILSNNTEIDAVKIGEISRQILENKDVEVQKLSKFGNAVEIISTEITNEEKENIIKKVNEEYGSDISNDDIDIISIPNTRIRDVLKPYILPGIITFVVILLYFMIMYNKIGLNKVLLKGIFIPIIAQLLYYSIIVITRIPFGRVVNSVAIGIYIISIGFLTICFQKEKENLPENDKKENDK